MTFDPTSLEKYKAKVSLMTIGWKKTWIRFWISKLFSWERMWETAKRQKKNMTYD